jgi:hypothetical protein
MGLVIGYSGELVLFLPEFPDLIPVGVHVCRFRKAHRFRVYTQPVIRLTPRKKERKMVTRA